MSTLSITSPGVQINEVDLSVIARPIGQTNVFLTGFAAQGPTEELISVSSISEYESIFGTPTNAAERYLYHSSKQILNASPASLTVARLPYGDDLGTGYSNSYSALVYPIKTTFTFAPSTTVVNNVTSTTWPEYTNFVNNNAISGVFQSIGFSNSAITNYSLVEPSSILLTDSQYDDLTQNNVPWNSSFGYSTSSVDTNGNITITYQTTPVVTYADIANAGMVIINKSKTAVDNLYEGYYVGLCDNSNINPATNFDAITAIKPVITLTNGNSAQGYLNGGIPQSRLNFTLTQAATAFGGNSISEVIESFPTGYDFSSPKFNDSLILVLFKIRTSIYNQDTLQLDYVISEGYSGSLYAKRTQNNPNGGTPITYFIDSVVDKRSNNIKVVTNPYISKTGEWQQDDVKYGSLPYKTVRVDNSAKNLYASGVYISETNYNSQSVGNISAKLDRIINQLQNNDQIDLDVVAEAGLGTIYASANERHRNNPNDPKIFDETYNVNIGGDDGASDLYSTDGTLYDTGVGADYRVIANKFVTLANDNRKDHVFIADPIRNIFVQGANGKISAKKNYVFSTQTYWPLKNQFSTIASSYVATYGNWLYVNDAKSDQNVWVPSSGWVAAAIASSSQTSYPWTAVAGFTRGVLTNVLDLGVNPNQKQRDQLYKININPIAFFPNDGFVIYGQKTLYRQPSAFDRLNVRRLFLTLEKSTKRLLKSFVFEPNTFSTRTRLVGALSPIFDKAKLNDGLYDYTIVCDDRNNTPDVIDNNELKVAIYIQPVRTAEFILVDFVATRTGVDFATIIGQ